VIATSRRGFRIQGRGGLVTQSRREATQRLAVILHQRGSPLADVVDNVDDVRELARPIRERIVDALGEEFAAKGLKDNSEPNAYGLELEALTDVCGLAWDNRAGQAGDARNDAALVKQQGQHAGSPPRAGVGQ
jgi:hypothetical protein